MESTYERLITLEEELRMKYEAVKRLGSLGYIMNKKRDEIAVFYRKDKVGKLIDDKVENVPIAVVEKRKFVPNDLLVTKSVMERNREVFKETLLDLGWAVSSYDKVSC